VYDVSYLYKKKSLLIVLSNLLLLVYPLSEEIGARRRKTHTVIKQSQVALRGTEIVLGVLVRGTRRHWVERRQGSTWARGQWATRVGTKIQSDTGSL